MVRLAVHSPDVWFDWLYGLNSERLFKNIFFMAARLLQWDQDVGEKLEALSLPRRHRALWWLPWRPCFKLYWEGRDN